MDIKDQAIARMTKECEGKEYLIPLEEYLTNICVTDTIAKKILEQGKTLEGAFQEMKKVAKSRAKNGFAYIPEYEGFEIVKEYYGIKSSEEEPEEGECETKDNVIDIMELL